MSPIADPARDHIRRRGHVHAREHRCRVPEDVAVAVVEREHHRARRQSPAVLEGIEELSLGDRVEAGSVEPAHLGREHRRRHREGVGDRRCPAAQRADAVVHEDGDGDAAMRQRDRQPQPHRLHRPPRRSALLESLAVRVRKRWRMLRPKHEQGEDTRAARERDQCCEDEPAPGPAFASVRTGVRPSRHSSRSIVHRRWAGQVSIRISSVKGGGLYRLSYRPARRAGRAHIRDKTVRER